MSILLITITSGTSTTPQHMYGIFESLNKTDGTGEDIFNAYVKTIKSGHTTVVQMPLRMLLQVQMQAGADLVVGLILM